ncbi:MAG: hypothetical protein QF707_01195 [Candidatus Poseidoniaceae archaeon]|nr:hypothetical protein [Candidatus Poseidoniaceae archaeon]
MSTDSVVLSVQSIYLPHTFELIHPPSLEYSEWKLVLDISEFGN